jgi:hypothetical protein
VAAPTPGIMMLFPSLQRCCSPLLPDFITDCLQEYD